jgi:hypothetical protein
MATFYINHDSGESSESQWTRHIQNLAYVEDVTKSLINSNGKQTRDFSAIVSRQTKEINDKIQSASREQIAEIQQSTSAICGTLDSGFELLSDNLQEISYGIGDLRSELNDMASMLDWKLSLFIEQQRITNLLMGNIAVLLRIPDIQKERQYYIEQGIKFLKNAIFDNDFYDDSLSNLLKAEKIEPTDFFALHRIGLIYMYSPKHLGLSKAEEYFKKAAKYAVAESNTGASVSINFLAGDVNRNLSDQIPTVDTIKLQAAESYLFAGRSCYIQGKLNEAADFASKGFNLVPQLVEAGFTQAKALAANNNEAFAATVLEKVINTDRFYSLKTLSDLDLCTKPSIQLLLSKLQKEATEKATSILEECKQKIISGSNAAEYIVKIERLVNKNTYLTSKKAIDLLNKVQDWKYCEPFKNPIQTKYLNEIIEIVNTLNTLHYYKVGNSFNLINSTFIDTFTNIINKESQWIFPFHSITNSNSNWTNNIKSNGGSFSVAQYLEIEKKLNDDLQNVVSNLKKLIKQYVEDNNLHLNYLDKERKDADDDKKKKRKDADDDNKSDSIRQGFLWGLYGLGFGIIGGIILGLVIWLISAIIGKNIGESGFEHVYHVSIAIFVILGFIIGYSDKREKK